ncbi:MAG: histidine phosphatase family protein [Burkholderiales bacterium]
MRHASHDLLGKALAGRAPGILLNERGRAEADQLVDRFANTRVAKIYTSPRERARDTAAPLAKRLKLTPLVNHYIDEIDFGVWTGRSFAELQHDPAWPVWVQTRSVAQAPGGEAFIDVQRRVIAGLEALRTEHPADTLALLTHGDVIKAALAYFLHLSLDNLERFDIAPASVSAIAAGASWAQVQLVNGACPPPLS